MFLAALVLAACGDSDLVRQPPPTPTPDPSTQVIATLSQGPVRITYVGANIPPGSTVSGCGPLIEGCAGRLRMTFRLEPAFDGPALWMLVFLHASSQQACLWSRTDAFELRAGIPMLVDVPLDRADRCSTPVSFVSLDGIVEGPVQIASRQEWLLRYDFVP